MSHLGEILDSFKPRTIELPPVTNYWALELLSRTVCSEPLQSLYNNRLEKSMSPSLPVTADAM